MEDEVGGDEHRRRQSECVREAGADRAIVLRIRWSWHIGQAGRVNDAGAARMADDGEIGNQRVTLKMGIVEFRMAPRPAGISRWPKKMRLNGMTLLISPSKHSRAAN